MFRFFLNVSHFSGMWLIYWGRKQTISMTERTPQDDETPLMSPNSLLVHRPIAQTDHSAQVTKNHVLFQSGSSARRQDTFSQLSRDLGLMWFCLFPCCVSQLDVIPLLFHWPITLLWESCLSQTERDWCKTTSQLSKGGRVNQQPCTEAAHPAFFYIVQSPWWIL